MNKFFLLFTCLLAGFQSHAQSYGSRYEPYGGNQYYSPIMYGPNGFRTVEEENRLMEQTIAEIHRQHRLESMSADEIEQENKRKEIKREVRMDAIHARKEKEQASAKKATAHH